MIAIVSPHLDDAALSCWTRLSGALVVNVFDGIPEGREPSVWDRICGYDDPAALARVRHAEDRAALGLAGSSGVVSIGAPEALHRDEDLPVSVIADAIAVELSKWSPVEELLLPLAGGPRANPDHRLARDAGIMVAEEEGPPFRLYADVPYCAKGGGWPVEWGGPNRVRWLSRVTKELRGRMIDPTGVAILSDDERDTKWECLALYETQMRALDRGLREKGLISDRDVWGREVLLDVL